MPSNSSSSSDVFERQMAAVHTIVAALRGAHEPAAMKALTLDAVIDLLDAEAGSLLMHDPAGASLVFEVARGSAADRITGTSLSESGNSIVALVFRSGDPVISNDPGGDARHDRSIDAASHFTTRSLLTVPLRRRGRPAFGVLQIVNRRMGEFAASDADALDVVGDILAMALENARLAREEQLAAVARMLGELGHDIGNMLTGILPYVQTLGQFVDSAAAREPGALQELTAFYAETLAATTESVERIRALTGEVAAAVKGETAPLALAPGDPAGVARDVARALAEAARTRGIALTVDGGEALTGSAEIDTRRLYNALYNLVNNALPETPSGGSVTILIDDNPHGERGEWYAVSVRDTGRGMPERVRAALFTDAAVSTKPGGTGLGTRIVRRIVEQHGGRVDVSSREGEGTTVRLLLPRSPLSGSE